MKDGPNIVRIAALIGDHARAEVLTALLGGHALTATELAAIANVTKQTISSHLARLVDAGLLTVEAQGRHRYFRLADDDVAQLLESMMGLAFRTGALRVRSSPREPALRKARVCYDHLAGELGVLVFDSLRKRRALALGGGGIDLTTVGRSFFQELGLDVESIESQRRAFCRTCLDWSERRFHLAGALGAVLLRHIIERKWARRAPDSRVVSFTMVGERSLREVFDA